RTERFRLIGFAIADEAPHLWLFTRGQATGLQVAIEARLVEGQDWAEAHRNGRKLPELRHQIRVGIRRQAAALGQFLTEMMQVPLIQPALQISPRINARRGVSLEINKVARKNFAAPTEEMIERHLVERRARGIRRNVAAETAVFAIGVYDHGHRIPAHVTLEPHFGLPITRIGW